MSAQQEIPSRFPHKFFTLKRLPMEYGPDLEERVPSTPESAKVVSSEIDGGNGMHTVMLDLDIPAALVPSSTGGHHHLYIDVPLTWRRYRLLLWVLTYCGVLERGYYRASVHRRATHLRPPWVKKADA